MPNCLVSNSPTIFLLQELLDDDLLDVKLSEDGDEEKSPNSSPMLLVGGDDYWLGVYTHGNYVAVDDGGVTQLQLL